MHWIRSPETLCRWMMGDTLWERWKIFYESNGRDIVGHMGDTLLEKSKYIVGEI